LPQNRVNEVAVGTTFFAPELQAAFFGGDLDSFNFPRFDFDLGLLRAYENNQPVASTDFFHWSERRTPRELASRNSTLS
jgi:hypothetical protein